MNSNPIIEKQQKEEAERRALADAIKDYKSFRQLPNSRPVNLDFRYPFHIVCVYEDKENSDFPIITSVREYCARNHLTYMARQYDIDKYSDDMFVHRLPAFHIYHKKYVIETHYYDTDPVHKIQIVIWAYQDEQIAKERKRQRRQEQWENFKENVNNIFSLERFKRKAALDPEASLSKVQHNQTEDI